MKEKGWWTFPRIVWELCLLLWVLSKESLPRRSAKNLVSADQDVVDVLPRNEQPPAMGAVRIDGEKRIDGEFRCS